jgi:hypothetical protein
MRIPKLIFGILFVFAGMIFTYFELYQFLFFTPLGVILLSHNNGRELDFENQKYRQYHSFFGKKRGDWLSLASYSTLIILRKDGKTNLSTTRSTISSSLRHNEYQVFLTDSSHRKRLYLKHFDTPEQARKYALGFMEKTGIPLEKYNPLISTETRNRR